MDGAIEQTAVSVVRARSLLKRYGSFTAVRNIDFDVQKQECFGFLGPNGAGKTSTMKMIYCRTPISGGELTVLGLNAAKQHRDIKSRIGVVAQDNDLDPDLTVRQNLAVYGWFFTKSKQAAYDKADELISFVQLEDKANNLVNQLSGGMKRRLTIARALVNDPELLILDEPTTALDPQARLMIWQKLGDLKARGVTLIVTTHYMEEATRLCDRLVVMHEGKILALGEPRALIQEHAGSYVLELPAGNAQTERLIAALGPAIHSQETHNGVVYVYTHTSEEARKALEEVGLPEGHALARESTLEDVFLTLTGRDLLEAS